MNLQSLFVLAPVISYFLNSSENRKKDDDDDGIPDFENVDSNTNADKENQINVLHPTQINKRFR